MSRTEMPAPPSCAKEWHHKTGRCRGQQGSSNQNPRKILNTWRKHVTTAQTTSPSPKRYLQSVAQHPWPSSRREPSTKLYKPGAFDLPRWQFGSLPPAVNYYFLTFKCISDQTLQSNTSSKPRKYSAVDPLQPQGKEGDLWICWLGSERAWA